jgi:5-formyltetrahydrofolate cyclo-ligase
MTDAKRQLRAAMRELVAGKIGAMSARARASAARRATDLALRSPPLARAKLVLAFRALADELDADLLALELAKRGVRLAFPLVVDLPADATQGTSIPHDPMRALRLLAMDTADPLNAECWRRDRYGILSPNPESHFVHRVFSRDLDAVIVPGRAFDLRGARLGRGKGFYDALLARLRPDARSATIGFVFESQIVERVPEASHDRRVAWIATEKRLRRATDPEAPARTAARELTDADERPEAGCSEQSDEHPNL